MNKQNIYISTLVAALHKFIRWPLPGIILISIHGSDSSAQNTKSQVLSLERLESALKSSPENITYREKLGELYFKKKSYNLVIQTLAAYANEVGSDSLVTLSEAYKMTDENLNRIRILKLYVDRSPQMFRPHHYLGLAYKDAKKFTEATDHLRQALSYSPRHRPSHDALLEIFMENKQSYEARQLLQEMIQLYGEKSPFLDSLCKLFAGDGFIDDAIKSCQKAIKQNPKFPDNHIYLAQSYYNQGKFAPAEKIFSQSAKQFKKSEFVQYAAGAFYLNEKNYPTAVRYLTVAVELNPKALRGHLTLAVALLESKDYAKSLVHFTTACGLDKTNDTTTQLKNAAGKLRIEKSDKWAEEFLKKAAVCQI